MADSGMMGMGASTLASGLGTILSSTGYAAGYRASANSYRSQARMAITRAQQQNQYLNEELASNVWQQYEQARLFMSAQNVAHAASGFADYSTGDKRLAADTIRKRDAAVESANFAAYRQAFETTKQAQMQAIGFNLRAQQADIMKRYYQNSKAAGFLTATGGALMTVSGAFMGGGAGGNVPPTAGWLTTEDSGPLSTLSSNKLQLNLKPNAKNFMAF